MASAEQHHILARPTFDKPVKVLIVVSPYYKDIADNMVAGAKAEIEAAGATWDLVEMPGALEIPTAIGISDRRSSFDGYVALGCVIRGETTHYETVCNDSSRAIQMLGASGHLHRQWHPNGGKPQAGRGPCGPCRTKQRGRCSCCRLASDCAQP